MFQTSEYKINELDTIDFAIPFQYCDFDCCMQKQSSSIGAHYKIEQGRIHFNLSSKLFATPTSLGAITINNVEEITQKLKALFEIEVDTEYLCTQAEMYRVHTKKDLMLDNHASMYLPYIRASLYRQSDKYIINRYSIDKKHKLKYENGLTAHPKQNKAFKHSIYNKGIELGYAINKEFRKIFEYDYYSSLKNMLRCETQINSYDQVRKFFKLEADAKPTLENILNSEVNVVANEFTQLIDNDALRYGSISDNKQGSLHDKMLRLQREVICDQFGNDMKDIEQYLKYTLGANANALSREKKEMKKVVADLCNGVINKNLMRELVDKLGENCYV